MGLRILRPIHEAEQVQFLLGQVNFLICFFSHSGRCTLSSLNLVYEVLLFPMLIPCQHQEDYLISWMREQSLVLFSPSGRRKMENMKLFEHPEALEFDQWGEGWTWIVNTLSFSPIVPFHVYVLFQCPISGGYQLLSRLSPSTSWAIPLHPSTPIVPGGVSV